MSRQRWADRQCRGFALLLALVVVLVLTALAVDMSYQSRVFATVAGNHRDRLQGYYLAQAGVEISLLRLQIDNIADRLSGKKDTLNEMQWAMPFSYPMGLMMLAGQFGGAEDGEEGQKAAQKMIQEQGIDGTFEASISDETAKINLNALGFIGNNPDAAIFLLQNLLAEKPFRKFFKDKRPDVFINSLVDWLDPDNESRDLSGGAEDTYYQGLPIPYHPRNGPFFSLMELRMVKEMRPEILEAIKPFITVYPYSLAPSGNLSLSKINVNTASAEVLAAIFVPQVSQSEEVAKKIVDYRVKTPFKNAAEFFETLSSRFSIGKDEVVKEIQPMIDVRTDIFRIESEAEVDNNKVKIDTVVDRSGGKIAYYYWKVD